MDKVEMHKRKRIPIRAEISKLITKCDPLLSVDIHKTDWDPLIESFELINEK